MPGQHGTFADCIARLPDIAAMGFDVLYMTPIHPIGRTNRKGRNNAVRATPGDPGSPYAIGSPEGGHDAIHRELGTLDDFRRLEAACRHHGMELALDFAVQCSPDHPWLPNTPTGSGAGRRVDPPAEESAEEIRTPSTRTSTARMPSSFALREVVLFWAREGCASSASTTRTPSRFRSGSGSFAGQSEFPDTIFLSEAFTRPVDEGALLARLQPVLHVFYLADDEERAQST